MPEYIKDTECSRDTPVIWGKLSDRSYGTGKRIKPNIDGKHATDYEKKIYLPELLPLEEYDLVIVLFSGGKDSTAAYFKLLELGAPHVYFTQFVDDTNPEERKLGLRCGLQLLRHCQLIRVYGCEVSAGMYDEIQLAGVLDIEIQVFGPPEFIENVLEIYNHAAVTQRRPPRKLAASAAAAYADQPAAAPLLAEAGKSLREVTAVHINIDPTEASELGEMIANSLKNGSSMLRGGA